MTQYIDKDALVAELKKRVWDYWSDSENTMGIYPYALEEVIKYVDTLEVKEVDLDKGARHYLLHEHLSPLNNVMHKADLKTEMQYHKDIESAFKAGYEFCLKTQKGVENEM